MRNLIFLLGLFLSGLTASAQESKHPLARPYFSAVIVSNMDTSVAWYGKLLDLKPRELKEVPAGFRISILESPDLVIELIENMNWPDQKSLLKDLPEGTRIRGFFKIGFKIGDMDAFLSLLQKLKIDTGRIFRDAGNKRNLIINDPDGNLVQLFEE